MIFTTLGLALLILIVWVLSGLVGGWLFYVSGMFDNEVTLFDVISCMVMGTALFIAGIGLTIYRFTKNIIIYGDEV